MELENNDIEIFVEDTEKLKQLRLYSDLVVLSCAGIPNPESVELADVLGIKTNELGFFAAASHDKPIETSREGIFLCGSAGGPQIIPDCVAQASAAAGKASSFVQGYQIPEPEQIIPNKIDPDEAPRIGVFVCKCGANIGRVVKTDYLAEEAAKLPGVVYSGVELFACADIGQNTIKEKITEHNLNRVVVAACTPRTHEPVFRKAILEAGLNSYLFEMANIRDQCTWVHSKEKEQANNKALDLIRMSVARSVNLQELDSIEVDVTKHALVIGGGIAGLQSAIDLNKLGLDVTLIEASDKLGGRVGRLHSIFPGDNKKQLINNLVKRIEDSGITVMLNSQVKNVSGYVGNFEVRIEKNKELFSVKAGALIIAIGSALYKPSDKWNYDKYHNVVTSMELENMLNENGGTDLLKRSKHAVFIQCVGSRAKNDGYSGCSRYCCPTSVKQASQLMNKGINCTVLYRDMRMVGKGAEEYYKDVRKQGVLFLRYNADSPIEFKGDNKVTEILYNDTLLRNVVSIPADLVVLAVGSVNEIEHSENLRQLLKVPKGEDGFFLERHPELGPVETCIDGVYICGTIQAPKDISDTLTQASAAAGKVSELLSKEKLRMEPVVCEVNSELCRACGECIDICEYHAPGLAVSPSGRETTIINRALCKGCGTCAVWCPTNAISAKHFTDEQIGAMITTLFEDYHV